MRDFKLNTLTSISNLFLPYYLQKKIINTYYYLNKKKHERKHFSACTA